MEWLWNILVGIISFIIGVFGFCQIVGVIRSRRYRTTGMIAYTISIWLAILGFATVAVHVWLYDYRIAFYIAMVISLLLSWNTGKNGPEEVQDANLHFVKQYDTEIAQQLEKIKKLDSMIEMRKNMLIKAQYDLGDLTVDDVIAQLNCGLISQEQADESINAIEILQHTINSTPDIIKALEDKKQEIVEQLNQF